MANGRLVARVRWRRLGIRRWWRLAGDRYLLLLLWLLHRLLLLHGELCLIRKATATKLLGLWCNLARHVGHRLSRLSSRFDFSPSVVSSSGSAYSRMLKSSPISAVSESSSSASSSPSSPSRSPTPSTSPMPVLSSCSSFSSSALTLSGISDAPLSD
uniref:Uncharacterized protein n=1 Tax=Anopheles atroparvus TaxID=41427 RepID=A0A182JI79_ANOAO